MDIFKTTLIILLVGLLLVACAQASIEPVSPTVIAVTPTASTQTTVPDQTGKTAVDASLALLAKLLNINVNQVKIKAVEEIEWPNACLGVQKPGEMCAEQITPGYRITLETGDKSYEFHTNLDGSLIRRYEYQAKESGSSEIPAGAPRDSTQEAGALLNIIWEQTGDHSCKRAEISIQEVAAGPCGGSMEKAVLGTDRAEELRFLINTYKTFTQETPAGTVEFKGVGQKEPMAAEMRSVSEWARLVAMEALGEQGGAGMRLVFTWHREGGFAGFCDDLAVDRAGWAAPTTCRVGQARNISRYRLTPGELENLYTWLDLLASFDYEYKDAATVDAMLVRVSFNGDGRQQATSSQKEEIASFGGQLYVNAANR